MCLGSMFPVMASEALFLLFLRWQWTLLQRQAPSELPLAADTVLWAFRALFGFVRETAGDGRRAACELRILVLEAAPGKSRVVSPLF